MEVSYAGLNRPNVIKAKERLASVRRVYVMNDAPDGIQGTAGPGSQPQMGGAEMALAASLASLKVASARTEGKRSRRTVIRLTASAMSEESE